jgi:fatty acid-binding protein DegV
VLSGFTGLSDDLLQKFLAEAQAKMGSDMALDSTIISGTIGTHVGPGAFAVAYFKK